MLMCSQLLANPYVEHSGKELMEEVYKRHQQYPFVFEQQSMVMKDRNGKRNTRKARRYSRVEEDGTAKFMLIFDFPEEIKGVTILATRSPDGEMSKSLYLPAFGEQMLTSGGDNSSGNFLGTDFTVENIIGEILSDYTYVRRQDRFIKDTAYFVIDAFRAGDDIEETRAIRKHFVRQDNLFISQTEHYDIHGRVTKRQSFHDLKAVDGEMWRSGMILMEDVKEQHESLLKVTRRMFSHDYVPAEMFSAEWLYENHPYIAPVSEEDATTDEAQESAQPEAEQLSEADMEEVMQP